MVSILVFLFLGLSLSSLYETDDDTDTYESDYPDPSRSPGQSGENQITLIVLMSIFGIVTIFTVGLCCYKRAKIGKVVDSGFERFQEIPQSPFSEASTLSELASGPEMRLTPSHMMLF
jgi:hypothetical protein